MQEKAFRLRGEVLPREPFAGGFLQGGTFMLVSPNPGSVTATTSTPVTVTGRSVTALLWYMRIAGVLMILFAILDGQSHNWNLLSIIAFNGPFFAPALAAIVGSFGRRVNWLLGVVLTLIWSCNALAFTFILGGPNGPGPIFQIPCILLAVIGIVIALLTYRAFARDF
jgi:peptidoglycan/LPS O-acetylase OafA/YrhL